MVPPRVKSAVLPTAQAAAEACARRILELLDAALALAPHATLAVSGGSSPKAMFDSLARSGFLWDRVHIFWVDERCVPPTDGASNYRMAYEHLIAPAGIPEANVHRIHGELEPRAAAALYEEAIRGFFGVGQTPSSAADPLAGLRPKAEGGAEMPRFDVVHRGIGADAHTASLFPGEPLIRERRGVAAAVFAPQFNQWRVTLLPGVLEAAKNTVILAAGADKAEAVRAVFEEPYDPAKLPAQIGAREADWFLDEAAARLLGGL
jgi:6-phosphogluconolactonase